MPDCREGRAWALVRDGGDAAWRLELPAQSGEAGANLPAAGSVNGGQAAEAPADAGPPRATEWMLGAGLGWSIDLLQSEGGRRYVAGTVSWGRDLMRDAGPGWLHGRLMWAVEAMPVYWQHAPTSAGGVGVSPLVWRWRFRPRPRAAAFVEMAFGGLFTTDAVPEGTERANFLTHGAAGIRWRPASRWSFVTAYRFQHISNGNHQQTNPGVNAHVLWIGVAR